ncbi:hypothetical protein BJY04DRAFT_214822 [Aspergillus karnatakaensis]|uniref:uncharacterized protein n=1 Tax=Aspergillus karnatakaensis TaxID=1810916 RepID=UPI003CCD79D1
MCELERFESDVAPPTNKPHSTSARASGITSDALPPELIEHVASYLGSKNTCSLRLTPSCLSKSSFYYFRSAFIFQGRTASHEASLRELECLAHNDNLARYIMSMAIRRTSHGRLERAQPQKYPPDGLRAVGIVTSSADATSETFSARKEVIGTLQKLEITISINLSS